MDKMTEADLCAAFIGCLPDGWTAYPETAGFDILLVRDADGFQIGVEAKLRLNAKVISQAMEHRHCEAGPDCRAVLVPPNVGRDMRPIAEALGITVIVLSETAMLKSRFRFSPTLPTLKCCPRWSGWHEMSPARRCAVPNYVPDVVAGAPAPVRLTRWKVGAIKLVILLAMRGHLTRADFKAHGIDIRQWVSPHSGWLVRCPDGFAAGPNLPDFKAQHPRVYEEIKAEMAQQESAA